jgi:hypothetical protein
MHRDISTIDMQLKEHEVVLFFIGQLTTVLSFHGIPSYCS